jgi:hypothetical protein
LVVRLSHASWGRGVLSQASRAARTVSRGLREALMGGRLFPTGSGRELGVAMDDRVSSAAGIACASVRTIGSTRTRQRILRRHGMQRLHFRFGAPGRSAGACTSGIA